MKTVQNLLLVFCSLFLTAVLIECGLRFIFPVYRLAAESQYDQDEIRIWRHFPGVRRYGSHPDSHEEIELVYNNHALRQNRDFSEDSLRGSVNVAFFGDSYTENLGLAAPYVFTEVLDYLLNETTGDQPFNVLNFGVNGYGTDQSYLFYRDTPLADDLDHVFYVMCMNDLRNIFENELFSLEHGELVKNPFPDTPWYLRIPTRLHTTYLLLDLRNRLLPSRRDKAFWYSYRDFHEIYLHKVRGERAHTPRAENIGSTLTPDRQDPDVIRTIAIFRSILAQWREEVEAKGAKFYIVALPREEASVSLRALSDEFEVVDLYDLALEADPTYEWETVLFQNDDHWNEAGNLLAAEFFYDVIAYEEGVQDAPLEMLNLALADYYSAFEGWQPDVPGEHRRAPEERAAAIRAKYLAL